MIIKDYLKSGYPLLWLLSHEGDRIINEIAGYYTRNPIGRREISTADGIQRVEDVFYSIFRWNIIEGWVEEIKDGVGSNNMLPDPLSALQKIPSMSSPAIFIMENFHPFLQNPAIIQSIKCLRDILKMSRRHLIFISPHIDLPVELQKDITLLEYQLPSAEELKQHLFKVLTAFDIKKETISSEVISKVVKSMQGLTLFEAENASCLAITRNNGKFDEGVIPTLIDEKKQIIRKSGILEYYPSSNSLQDVGGLDNLKLWLQMRRQAFSSQAKDFGLPIPKGILIVGVSGTGKSLIAKSISHEWQMPLVRLDIGKVFGSLVGQSEQNIRLALKTIDALGECIVWVDEIEKGMAGSKSSGTTDSGVTARVMGTILTWMQEKTTPSFVVATANDVSQLPPELIRKGRWDECFFVDLPTSEERMSIFSIHLRKRKRNPADYNLSLSQLAQRTDGYTGAEIEQVIIEALYNAFNDNRDLKQEDIIGAISTCVPLSRTMKEQIDALREWAKGRARFAGKIEEKSCQNKIRTV